MSLAPQFFTPFRTVRAKLVFWSVTVLALSLFLFGGLLRYQVQHDILQTVDSDLERFSHRVADDWTDDRDRRRNGEMPEPDFDRPGPPPVRFGRGYGPQHRPGDESSGGSGAPLGTPVRPTPRILSLTGQVLEEPRGPGGHERNVRESSLDLGPWDTAAFEAARDSGQAGHSTVHHEDETLRVYTTPLRDEQGQAQAILQISRPLSEINWAIGRVSQTLWLFAPLCIAIAGFGGAFLTSRVLSPIRKLTQAAETITAQELSERLPVTGQDEFAHLSATFNRMLSRLETSFEQQRRFTSDASHELRTPLAAIKAHTSLALQGERSAQELRQTLVTVDNATDRASRTVQDLLLLARSDTGRLGIHMVPTYLPDVTLRAIETVEAATGYSTQAAAIEMRLEGPPPTVAGDAHHLTRLFTNLIENAVRHTPPGGQVQVLMQTRGDQVTVSVVDTGVGIAPEHLPHLGERFYRIDSSRARTSGGTGLGLAICRSIVEAHGGKLSIDSTLGRGTTVQVTLGNLAAIGESS